MKKVRIAFLLLLLGLIVFYNIERLDLGTQNTLNIRSYVYILITLASLTILLFPALSRYHFSAGLLFWGVVYAIIKFVIFRKEIIEDGSLHFYLTLLEFLFLVIILMLAYNLSMAIRELETIIENIALGSVSNRVKLLTEAQEEIKLEVYRGRRFNTPISLLVIGFDEVDWNDVLSDGIKEMQAALVQHYALNKFISSVADEFRRSDMLLADYRNNRCVILSPGTNSDGLTHIIRRLNEGDEKMKGVKIRIDSAVFPEDALTFEDLLNKINVGVM